MEKGNNSPVELTSNKYHDSYKADYADFIEIMANKTFNQHIEIMLHDKTISVEDSKSYTLSPIFRENVNIKETNLITDANNSYNFIVRLIKFVLKLFADGLNIIY